MSFRVAIRRPGYRQPYIIPSSGIKLEPVSWSSSIVGGAEFAELDIIGGDAAVLQALRWLAHRIEIYNDSGAIVWYGLIDDVSISSAGLLRSASLDRMANKIRVAFTETQSDLSVVRGTTNFAQNDLSVELYGVKEMQVSRANINSAMAVSIRDALLSNVSSPTSTSSIGFLNRDTAKLRAVGLWQTLSWQYYQNSSTAEVATSTQIQNVLDEASWVQNVEMDTPSSINAIAYRDGDSTIQTEVETLLEAGTSSGRRYIADVDRWDRVWVRPQSLQPQYSNNQLDRYGVLSLAGGSWPRGYLPSGQWVDIKGGNQPPKFVFRASYAALSDTYRLEGMNEDPFDIGVIDG